MSLDNVLTKTQQGSIIVFHDSVKSYEKLKYVLPFILEHFSALGYSFNTLTKEHIKKPVLISKIA